VDMAVFDTDLLNYIIIQYFVNLCLMKVHVNISTMPGSNGLNQKVH